MHSGKRQAEGDLTIDVDVSPPPHGGELLEDRTALYGGAALVGGVQEQQDVGIENIQALEAHLRPLRRHALSQQSAPSAYAPSTRPRLHARVLPCVPMKQIGVRELRQNASEWIRRAHAGERIEVTRRGEVMAVLGPPPQGGALARLREAGQLKPASLARPLPGPVATSRPASDALAELRADER